MEKSLTQAMEQLNLPTRDDVTRLAERLTNIEMRLDDMEAKLDEDLPRAPQPATRKKAKSSTASRTGGNNS